MPCAMSRNCIVLHMRNQNTSYLYAYLHIIVDTPLSQKKESTREQPKEFS